MSGMIAVNTMHTGDRKRDNRGYAESMNPEQVDGLLREDWLRKMVADIRSGNEGLKDRLPYICPHYSAFRNNHRAQADILPETFTHMTCVDVDDEDKVATAIKRAMELNKDEYSDWEGQLLRMAYSARRKLHLYIRIPKGMTIAEAQQAYCQELEIPYDESCTTPERFIYLTGMDEEIYRSPKWLVPLGEEELAERREAYLQRGLDADGRPLTDGSKFSNGPGKSSGQIQPLDIKPMASEELEGLTYKGVPYQKIIEAWALQRFCSEEEEAKSRHTACVSLARDLYIMTDRDAAKTLALLKVQPWVEAVIRERREDVEGIVGDAAAYVKAQESKAAQKGKPWLPKPSKAVLAIVDSLIAEQLGEDADDEQSSILNPQFSIKKLPQGIRDSIEAGGQALAMPMLTAVCPCIGALATGVRLDVHGKRRGLNLITYIVGESGSGKDNFDDVVTAWMSELQALDDMYDQQEKEWRKKKKAALNQKNQPEEPQLPIRNLTLNNTVANLAQQLENVQGKHAFSFTPEADTVAQKWRSQLSDFSVMLRQSYDGSKYERKAKSLEAVNVKIEHLLWNVCMCGTPDALYRVVSNYTDGLQTRIAIGRTPDNTYTQLEDDPSVLTTRQRERIQQVAHLLPLMAGEVVLPKLEQRGRQWLERIRLETMMNDDRVKARQRMRICVTAQRMTCCLMLCQVCEKLIRKHGLSGAENLLKQQPGLWKEMLLKAQTPQMMELYDLMADYLMENALLFFRERIENAFKSRDYAGYQNGERMRRGRNDSIYERLDPLFTFEQAMQQSVVVKGANVNHNTVRQMLKNWKRQGLVFLTDDGRYRKN